VSEAPQVFRELRVGTMATTFILRINTRVLANYHGFVGQNIKLYAQVAGKSLSRESVGDFIIHHPGLPPNDDDLPPAVAPIWRSSPRHDYFGEGVSEYQQMVG